MSTIGDVIHDSTALVRAIDELLLTKTVQQMPQIARDLGVRPQFDAAVGKAGGVLQTAAAWTGTAWEVAVAADAAIALFGLLPKVALGLSDAITQAGTQARELDLDFGGLDSMTKQMSGAMAQVSKALDVVEATAEDLLAFVDPPQLRALQRELLRAGEALAALSAPPAQDRLNTDTSSAHPALTA